MHVITHTSQGRPKPAWTDHAQEQERAMADAVAVVADRLSKSYRHRPAIERVTFAVERGQICGLLGPNGAGKTTTMRILVGLSRPDAGTARLFGEPSRLAADVLARVGVAI